MANPTKYGLAPSPFQWIFPSSLAALCSSLDHPPTVDFSKIDLSLDQDTDRIQISIPLFASSSNPSSSLHSCDLRCLVRLNCPSCTLFDSTSSSTSDHNEPCCRLVLKGIPSLSTNDKSYPTSQVPSAAQYPLSPNARYPLDHHDIHLGKALLGKALLSNIAEEIVDFSMSNGAIVGQSMESIQHVPMTALPSYLPLSLFHQLCALSTDWGILIDRISRNTGFLSASLSSIASVDDFTRHLLDINHTVQTEGLKQQTILHIHRADYMMHASEDEDEMAKGYLNIAPQLVETNTIAAAAGCLSSKVAGIHRFIVERFLASSSSMTPESLPLSCLPENPATESIAHAIASAHFIYLKQHPPSSFDVEPSVLMIVHPNEFNRNDQKSLEYCIWRKYQIPIIRRSLLSLHTNSFIQQESYELVVESQFLITVAYYRAGYAPTDYLSPLDEEWQARLKIERSLAIKCPSIGAHLAGSKKIQQLLCEPGVVESFFLDTEQPVAARLRSIFGECYAIGKDDETTNALISQVLNDPASYVLKPQREGGGNNLWGEEMCIALRSLPLEERGAYILMKRIVSRPRLCALVRAGQVAIAPCISELGIFGALCSSPVENDLSSTEVHFNEYCGYLLRTKLASQNEGGIAVGIAVIDSLRFQE